MMWRINSRNHIFSQKVDRRVSFSSLFSASKSKGCSHSKSKHEIMSESSSSTSLSSSSSSSCMFQLLSTLIRQPFHVVHQFQNGLTRLKYDYLKSLYIQDAELTRQHLQRKIRFNYEQYRRRVLLLRHGRAQQNCGSTHGVVTVDSSEKVTFSFPSNNSSLPSFNSTIQCPAQEMDATHRTTSQLINSNNDNNNYGNIQGNKLIVLSHQSNELQQQHYLQSQRHHPPLPRHHPFLSNPSSIITRCRRRRSQEEHLRSLSRDLQTTLPTVAAFLFVPVVGYAFLLLGMMFPRLLLSRQFHTSEQRREFAMLEYGQRQRWFGRLNGDFWGGCMRKMPRLCTTNKNKNDDDVDEKRKKKDESTECREGTVDQDEQRTDRNANPPFLDPLTYVDMDAAGPVFAAESMQVLYHLCRHNFSSYSNSEGRYSIMDNLQPTHLHSIALSNNLATAPLALPTTLAYLALHMIVPSVYLKRKLIALAEDIILDDIALIEEGQIYTECMGLTEEEVLEACWIRGLPVGRFVTVKNYISGGEFRSREEDEVPFMRRVLKHHLQMMEDIMEFRDGGDSTRGDTVTSLRSRRELVRDGTLLLLVLHLPAIRYSMGRVNGPVDTMAIIKQQQ